MPASGQSWSTTTRASRASAEARARRAFAIDRGYRADVPNDHALPNRGRVPLLRAAAACLLAICVAAMLAPAPVLAAGDPVPLPRFRPAYAPRVAAPSAAIAQPQPQINPNSRFTPEQQIALQNINRYFNSFRLMEGEFIQFGPSGDQSEGVFFLSKPGRIRFHYRPPVKLDIIADGSTVAIKDGRARTQDMYPLGQTPLRFLLADRIDLTNENLVTGIREEPDLISLHIVDNSSAVQGSLTLIFDRKTFELRQWVVTDAQGLNTSIAIYNTATGKPQDRTIYIIDVRAFQ